MYSSVCSFVSYAWTWFEVPRVHPCFLLVSCFILKVLSHLVSHPALLYPPVITLMCLTHVLWFVPPLCVQLSPQSLCVYVLVSDFHVCLDFGPVPFKCFLVLRDIWIADCKLDYYLYLGWILFTGWTDFLVLTSVRHSTERLSFPELLLLLSSSIHYILLYISFLFIIFSK